MKERPLKRNILFSAQSPTQRVRHRLILQLEFEDQMQHRSYLSS